MTQVTFLKMISFGSVVPGRAAVRTPGETSSTPTQDPRMIGNPEIMRLATRYGLPRTTLMKFLLKVMANLAEPHGGDASDRLITALSKMAPDA